MNRRRLLTGLVSLVAAPAIVKASSLMALSPLPKAAEPLALYSYDMDRAVWMVHSGFVDALEGVPTHSWAGIHYDGDKLWVCRPAPLSEEPA